MLWHKPEGRQASKETSCANVPLHHGKSAECEFQSKVIRMKVQVGGAYGKIVAKIHLNLSPHAVISSMQKKIKVGLSNGGDLIGTISCTYLGGGGAKGPPVPFGWGRCSAVAAFNNHDDDCISVNVSRDVAAKSDYETDDEAGLKRCDEFSRLSTTKPTGSRGSPSRITESYFEAVINSAGNRSALEKARAENKKFSAAVAEMEKS